MKIKAVKMKHFGKFADKELEFGDGLNIIEGDNEAGKSTLHAFIRGMLFGIEKPRGRTGRNDIYSRYLPWDTPGAYQGSLDLELEGRNIRISRVFLQNARSCIAQDIDTSEDIGLGEAGITALMDKLTPAAFDNTVSCAQQQLKSKDDFGDYIRSYIANMADSRDSDVDVSAALEMLDEHMREIGKKLKDTDETAAREELDSLLEDEKDESYIIADRDEAVSIITALENEKRELEENVNPDSLREQHDLILDLAGRLKMAEQDRSAAAKYAERAEEYGKRLDECENRLVVRTERLRLANGIAESLKSDLADASTGENDPDSLTEESDKAAAAADQSMLERDTLIQTYESIKLKARKLMLAGGGVTAAGLAAAVIFSERSKIGIITGVILMLAGLVGLLFGSVESRSAKKMPAGIDEAKERADKDRETADRLKAGLEKLRADIDNIREQLQKAELNLKNAEAEVKETTVERNGILERKAELEADLKEAAENVEKERSNILAELDKAGYLQENGDLLTYLEKISAEQTDAIKSFEAKRRELEAALTEKHRELARIEGTLQRYGDIGERIDEASKHLDEVRARKEELTNELEAVKTAASAIKEISDDFKAGFDRKINDLLGKACGLITSGKYTKARITGDCEPQVMGDSGYIPVRALSVGAAEQVFLAFRLAMAEFIFENEEIPLIFDEVFAYYDDNRLRAALEALSKLKGCQIFLFACSGRERKILDGSGIGYYQIRL